MASLLTPTIKFKRGDDFKLDMAVADMNNTTAIANANAVVVAQSVYDAALAAVPQVPVDIQAANLDLAAKTATYDASIVVDITGWVVTSQISWRGKLVDNFVVAIPNPTLGLFNLTLSGVHTALWSPRIHSMDIQFVHPGGKVSSDTLLVDVERDITNG